MDRGSPSDFRPAYSSLLEVLVLPRSGCPCDRTDDPRRTAMFHTDSVLVQTENNESYY